MQTMHANVPQEASEAKSAYRDRIELLRSRVSMLTGKDRLLMTMYLENGNTIRQLARLAGVSEASISRRIHKITKRLVDSRYMTCLQNRDKFTRAEMAIAKEHFLLGLSLKGIARRHRCSAYHVYKVVRRIQKVIDGANSTEPRG
ncbi:MAG: helix-turn-helix domain-containing protein [Planctomycetota bacterium]